MDTIMEAVHLMENNQSEDAIKLLEGFIPTTDDDKKYTIAEFYLQWGFLQEALVLLKELLDKYPNESDIKVMLADIYIELKDDKAAIDLLADINEDDPIYLQVLLQLADLYQTLGLFEVAELKLLEAKKLNPDEPIIDFALGEFLFSISEYKRSIIYYEKIPTQTKELAGVTIATRLAEAYASSGEYEIALSLFQKTESNNPDTLFKFGFTAYHANRKDIAINVWKRVIDLDEHYHSVYYELAKAYREEGLIKEAYETGKQGLQMDEFNKELYYYTGVLAQQLGNLVESEKLVREAIALDSDYKEAVLFLIELLKKKDDNAEIVALVKDINSLGAEDSLYDWELARAYYEEESYSDALESYQKTYENHNEDGEFLKEYGEFLIEEGKVAEAIPIFEAYLQQEPQDVEMVEYVERVKQSNDVSLGD